MKRKQKKGFYFGEPDFFTIFWDKQLSKNYTTEELNNILLQQYDYEEFKTDDAIHRGYRSKIDRNTFVYHSINDKPAFESQIVQKWFLYGKLHRDKYKPAVIFNTGEKMKFMNGKCLSMDSPNYDLLEAVIDNHPHVVEFCLDVGADIHMNNDSSLRIASSNNRYDIVEILVNNGANIHIMNETPLFNAVNNNNIEMVKLLVSKGAKIHVDNDRIINFAKANNRSEIVEFFKELQKDEMITAMAGMYNRENDLSILDTYFLYENRIWTRVSKFLE